MLAGSDCLLKASLAGFSCEVARGLLLGAINLLTTTGSSLLTPQKNGMAQVISPALTLFGQRYGAS
jgi:hypothetical protein